MSERAGSGCHERAGTKARPAALAHLSGLMQAPDFQPFLKLWLEIAARAGRGEAPYPEIAREIGRRFLDWGAGLLAVADEQDRAGEAAVRAEAQS